MRTTLLVVAGTAIVFGAAPLYAQPRASMTSLETSIACAPPASLARPDLRAPRVLGSQDTVPRGLYGPRDLLIIDSGVGSGVQLGDLFFVRRQNRFGTAYGGNALTARTLGWIRIVAVNQTTAVATVEHSCDGIMTADYLEPFVAPSVPDGVDSTESIGEPDFSALARVLSGTEDRSSAAPGDIVLIDVGADRGLAPGTRLAVYRDVRTADMPLSAIGDAVVVTVGPSIALARVTRARDAVLMGDYMFVRK
jgi:hypothetical protein